MFKTPCIQRDRIGNTYKEAKKTAGLVSLFIVLKVLIARSSSKYSIYHRTKHLISLTFDKHIHSPGWLLAQRL